MPNAVISNQFYSGDGTQLSFITAISTAMQAVGFNELDSYQNTNGGEVRVFNYVAGVNTYDNLIIVLDFTSNNTSGRLFWSGFETWDNILHTGIRQSENTYVDFIFTSNFSFTLIEHPEIRGVYVLQGGVQKVFFGYIRPDLTIPFNSYFDTNSHPCGFISRNRDTFNFTTVSALQFISSSYPDMFNKHCNFLQIQDAYQNFYNDNRCIYPATITNNSNSRTILIFSSDIIISPRRALSFGDTINNTYKLLQFSENNNIAGIYIKYNN